MQRFAVKSNAQFWCGVALLFPFRMVLRARFPYQVLLVQNVIASSAMIEYRNFR
jgi:hypothetical protein